MLEHSTNGRAHVAPEVTATGTQDAALPVEGSIVLPISVERIWTAFSDVSRWPEWIPCMFFARVLGGELKEGATLAWCFNAIRPWYPYKLPALAKIVAVESLRRVTWEVSLPGFHALHTYHFERIDERSCRFGSHEIAEGPMYKALRPFWLAHFRFVCAASLEGASRFASELNHSPRSTR